MTPDKILQVMGMEEKRRENREKRYVLPPFLSIPHNTVIIPVHCSVWETYKMISVIFFLKDYPSHCWKANFIGQSIGISLCGPHKSKSFPRLRRCVWVTKGGSAKCDSYYSLSNVSSVIKGVLNVGSILSIFYPSNRHHHLSAVNCTVPHILSAAYM